MASLFGYRRASSSWEPRATSYARRACAKIVPCGSWRNCVCGWRSSRYRCIRARRSDRVWPPCGGQPREAWSWQTGDVQLLGFTHICGRSRAGYLQLKRKTRRDRMRVKLKALKGELRRRMHVPIPEQGRWLAQVVRGYFAYHAVPTNAQRLTAFRYHVTVLWHRTLRRRSQKDWTRWERMSRLVEHYLPPVRILHPWPSVRFAVKHHRWEPGA